MRRRTFLQFSTGAAAAATGSRLPSPLLAQKFDKGALLVPNGPGLGTPLQCRFRRFKTKQIRNGTADTRR